MTQDTNRVLGGRAAEWAKSIEAWPEDDGETRRFIEAFGVDHSKAEITTSGTVTSAYLVIQPSSPRVEFEPFVGTLTLYDNGDSHTTHVNECAARDQAADYLTLRFDGVEVDT